MTEEENSAHFKFQSELPESIDGFIGQGHKNAAKALQDVIVDHPYVHVLGVEGNLGAGKSTSIKILESQLDENTYKFIYFDVDQHHYSSIKSSFIKIYCDGLDEIIADKDKPEAQCYKDEALGNTMSYKKKTKSNISMFVVIFAVTLVLFTKHITEAIEVLFISYNAIANSFSGKELSFSLERAVVLLSALSPFVFFIFLKIYNYYSEKIKRSESSLSFGDLLKRNGEDSIKETMDITREVGSYELKKAFLELSSLIPKDKVVIIVIDNIDRVEPSTVREVWSDLDVFTSLENQSVRIILPYSEVHVANAINKDSFIDGKEFISKRLPVVFRAPPIVTVGWREKYKKYWKETLGEVDGFENSADIINVWSSETQQITPRFLKKHVNDIACLMASNNSKVNDATYSSAYLLVVKYHRIDLKELLSSQKKSSDSSTDEENKIKNIKAVQTILNRITDERKWSIELACIHFQTNEEIAQSELLEEPIYKSVMSGDIHAVMRLSKVYGYDYYFKVNVRAVSTQELIKLSSDILDSEYDDKQEWVQRWMPVFNQRAKNEGNLVGCDREYIKAIKNLIENHDLKVELRLVNNAIKQISKDIRSDIHSANALLDHLYWYSTVEEKIPEIITNCPPEVFVKELWWIKDNFPFWEVEEIAYPVSKRRAFLEVASSEYAQDDSYWEIFEWLMKSHRLDEIKIEEEREWALTIKSGQVNMDDYACYVVPFCADRFSSDSLDKLVKRLLKNEITTNVEQWTAFMVISLICGGNYTGNTLVVRNGQNSRVKLEQVVFEIADNNSGYERFLKQYVVFATSFNVLIGSLKHDKVFNVLAKPLLEIIKEKRVSALDINGLLGQEAYELIRKTYKENSIADFLDFLKPWEKHLKLSLEDISTDFVEDVIEVRDEFWENMFISLLENDLKNEACCVKLVEMPHANYQAILPRLVNTDKTVKSYSKLRTALISIMEDKQDHEMLALDSSYWLKSLMLVLPPKVRGAIARKYQARLIEQTASMAERFAIIRNFGSFIFLVKPESESACDIVLGLFEQADNDIVIKWLDSQSENLFDGNDSYSKKLLAGLGAHEGVAKFVNIKAMLEKTEFNLLRS
ncbi:P-loop NTPase fold protein [Cobetia sp. SIMBA_158]|uniref:P-loop NTPase fold protein n=2 Tax=Gammaproteobacteria TaxID=1236 RepID=UPI00398178D9